MSARQNSFARHARETDREALAVAQQARRQQVAAQVAQAAQRVARADAEPALERDAIDGAQAVRIRHLGWHELVRVNKASVTVIAHRNVDSGTTINSRFPLADVVEARA